MKLKDEKATLKFGRKLAAALRPGDVVTLSGPLSAGKTTLVRGLLAGLGHEGEVPSPSFAIVQPYEALSPPVCMSTSTASKIPLISTSSASKTLAMRAY